jgi:hypothetical protein
MRHPTGFKKIDQYNTVHCRIDLFLIVLDGKISCKPLEQSVFLSFWFRELFWSQSNKNEYYVPFIDCCMMSITRLILERRGDRQIEVKT